MSDAPTDLAKHGSSKIYTRTGDKGKTSLVGGCRVSKSDPRLTAYGTIDELNSFIGMLSAEIARELKSQSDVTVLQKELQDIQVGLFDVGSRLACEDPKLLETLPNVPAGAIEHFEMQMDSFSENLTPLKNFILPGGTVAASIAHVARAVCRRAERDCVALSETGQLVEPDVIRYVNRLSDYLFVLARYLCSRAGALETLWAPRKK
jgi:cob(I)alamin adenosyltransferase